MPDESGFEVKEPQNQQALAEDQSRPGAAASEQPRSWGRADRNRLFIFAGIGFCVPAALIFGLHSTGGRSSSVMTVRNDLPVRATMAFFIALATWVVSRLEKRPLEAYGIPLRQALGKRFWEGSAWGFAMLSAILLILRVSGHFRIDSVALAGGSALRWALAWGATFLVLALNEELVFRGYWLFTMAKRIRFWRAAFFLSAIFGIAHVGNHGENGLGILQVVVVGLLFCLMIRRTGNLWFAIGFHAAWDWAQTFFFGTPDSGLLGLGRFLNTSVSGPDWLTGGSAGPEGSIFAVVVLLLCAALIHVRFPKVNYPDRPV